MPYCLAKKPIHLARSKVSLINALIVHVKCYFTSPVTRLHRT
jgi:hypothetical protein